MALSGNATLHTVATTPFEGQKPGTSGLRKKVTKEKGSKASESDGDDASIDRPSSSAFRFAFYPPAPLVIILVSAAQCDQLSLIYAPGLEWGTMEL